MPPLLTPQQKTVFGRIAARTTDQLPLLEFLEALGLDMKDYRERWAVLKQQAETALQLNELSLNSRK